MATHQDSNSQPGRLAHHNIEEILEIAARTAKHWQAKSQIENINIASGYAEPGYSEPESGVALGNWNNVSEWDEGSRTFKTLDSTPSRIGAILEKLGYALEWSDEWKTCDGCYLVVRSSPDCYSWQPSYVQADDGSTYCLDCLDPEEHLACLEGNEDNCNVVDSIDPSEHGYLLIKDGFESGMHHGQDASPKKIAKLLRDIGVERFIFNTEETSQFYITFSVWLHSSEKNLLKKAKRELGNKDTNGPSNAEALKRGLEEATRQMPTARPGEIVYQKICGDEVETKVLTPEEFVKGVRRSGESQT